MQIFVVPEGDPALLGMLDIEIAAILSVKCSIIEPQDEERLISKV